MNRLQVICIFVLGILIGCVLTDDMAVTSEQMAAAYHAGVLHGGWSCQRM